MSLVTENWSERKLSKAAGGYRAQRGFVVTGVTTLRDAIDATVAAYPDTAFNHTHPQSTWLYMDNQDGAVKGFNVWNVLITYSSNPAGRHVDPGNPLSEPYRYRFEWGNTTETCDRDTYGKLIVNAANELFDGGPPTDVINGYLIVERNEPYYDALNAVAFSNTVNNANVTFFSSWLLKKGQACCRRIVPVTAITSAAVYVTVQYTIELRRGYKLDPDGYYDGFKFRILNAGRRGYYDSGGGVIKRGAIALKSTNGGLENVGSDVLLDATGKPLLPEYVIATLSGFPGYATPVASPTPLPSTTVVEDTGYATFVKQFPQTLRLDDLSVFGF